MSEELLGVVVCHGSLAAALVQAEERVLAALGGRAAVVFVDLASGSCSFAVLKRLRGEPSVKVVTGVNLAMLVDFVFHRNLSPADAAARAVAAGEKSIRIP